MSDKPLWYPSPNLIAQLAHFAWGALIVLVGFLFGYGAIGILFLFAYAVGKEFIFDLVVEKDSVDDSCQDFSFYILGGMAAFMLVIIALVV